MVVKNFSRYDRYLFNEGNFFRAFESFGAHCMEEDGVSGIRFTLWAPQACQVNVAGDFNTWQATGHPLQRIEESDIWTGFIPHLKPGELYKYEIITREGKKTLKADPFAFYAECRPGTASIVYDLQGYEWQDQDWMNSRKNPYREPLNIYEVHLGSWKRRTDGGFYNYRELAHLLVDYVTRMGYTHIELMPIMEHPFDGSWGYQITGFYAVTSRYGTPEDFMYFVDYCHQKGIGVILDWVPAHFCKDRHGLALLDGAPLYEGEENKQWGTLHFDYAKPQVVSFLVSNAYYWFEVFHVDGLRVDAVASMIYRDFGRNEGEWKPNKLGGRENLEAVEFIKKLNAGIFRDFPTALMIAEESTAWPLVTQPTYLGGLGFNLKWNMGWMNDILKYMEMDPLFRSGNHNLLTFSLMYAFSENFILPLSHDEVVHGKKSLIEKMPGDYWQKFANLRLLLGYMMTHPGKKLLFMGQEIAQFIEWRYYEELEWKLLEYEKHSRIQEYVRKLNHFYLQEKALWQQDYQQEGFCWIDADNNRQSVAVYRRAGIDPADSLVIICSFTPVCHENFRIGVPRGGWYQEVFNSDEEKYGGWGRKNYRSLWARRKAWQNQPYSLELIIPPLSIIVLKLKKRKGAPDDLKQRGI